MIEDDALARLLPVEDEAGRSVALTATEFRLVACLIDGYDEDWPAPAIRPATRPADRSTQGLRMRAALHGDTLFLLVDVDDTTPVWHASGAGAAGAGGGCAPGPGRARCLRSGGRPAHLARHVVARAHARPATRRIGGPARRGADAPPTRGRAGHDRLAAGGGVFARDELDELSRDLSALPGRSADYTRYLEALSSRLSHELGTPLAVVHGALENIERGRLDDESAALVARAGTGAAQLGALLRALVESTRLERTLARAERVPLDLDAFVVDCVTSYAHAWPGVRVTLRRTLAPGERAFPASGEGAGVAVRPTVAPEALLQALDKLVDNAVDFSIDGEVQLVLAPLEARAADAPARFGARRQRWRGGARAVFLGVSDRGAPLAPEVAARLFDPMSTGRAGTDHLGLGLHVVRLVAALHGGRALLRRDADRTTVGLVLPIEPDAFEPDDPLRDRSTRDALGRRDGRGHP